ncbi:hypothetical protein CHLRE_06g301450v5 [Chlamydomonas reinhardtii]|uniref:Uncharacterized protein n=1 Tax=Chlamydomonas reinhardtii TaxID=3055 RepID=A0A2K3DR01_CHLRE|nr:uncharacterized protein CHLRE_06g301450v5 [Chlamydomonas reinhardtii]PNW82964.1 hypothetical protein CHLRE_06g301450v5 [Chlamydomonas reinhardtii]
MALVGLRAALESLLGPARAGRFTDADLRLLLEGGYATLDDLKDASYTGLQQAGLKPARADQIFHAQGSATSLGVESTTGFGPPACKLQLRQDSQNQDLFFFEPMDTISGAAPASPGVSSSFFLDPEGRQTDELQNWLCLAKELYRAGKPILPLFINGPVKSGKSFMLNNVLPAVANTYCSGGSDRQHTGAMLSGPNFLRVSCLGCDRSSGSSGFLMDFLRRLKQSAADQQLSAAASTPLPSDSSAGAMVIAIQDFMRRLPRDRLNFLLIDEAQSFYLVERPVPDDCPPRGATLDVNAVLYMRRILKELLLDSPHWVAWAVTGSSMATLWANVAATPTNGFALIIHHRRLNLSPTVSMDVLQVAWEQLKAQAASWNPALPKDLVWRSPPQVAMLAYLCQEWRYSRRASTAAELVEQTMTEKLIPEVLADLRMVLQLLGQPAAQLKLLRKLLDPMAGVEPAALPLAFKVLLASFATEREGRLYLDYPLFAQVLQAVTKDSGELLDSITAVKSISSKKFRELVVMGECCKDTENFDSYKDLHSLLEDMASALALTPDGLLKADWFIQVLDHLRNSCGSKANFEEKYGAQARQDVKVGLRWFHGLLRNVLSHGSISEQQQALDAYPSELAEFHSSGRISEVLTKTYDRPMPRRSRTRGASAAATPRAQPQPYAGPVRPISLHLGKRLLGRAAVTQPRYIM